MAHAKSKLQGSSSNNNDNNSNPSSPPSSARNNTGSDGRPYTDDQVEIVQTILRAKQTGRQAHYRVLGIESNASESDIKKAYRKKSLKVHPDKNSAPQADEAFKAVSLAYATLSDENKRVIYDRYGDEDPDNRGGGRGGMHMRHGGQDVSPEDIFNAFFGHMNGMPGGAGGPGVHFYTNGFGPGMHFQAGGPRGRQRNAQEAGEGDTGFAALLKFLPFLLMLIFSLSGSQQGGGSKYEGQYFTLSVCISSLRPPQNHSQLLNSTLRHSQCQSPLSTRK